MWAAIWCRPVTTSAYAASVQNFYSLEAVEENNGIEQVYITSLCTQVPVTGDVSWAGLLLKKYKKMKADICEPKFTAMEYSALL